MALYRKYRPGSFAEVVGQEQVTRPLSVALDSGRINHAYLFSGPRGCGKTSSARILARSLNCEQGPTSTPCGVCNSCVALAPNGPGTLDVTELDAASNNGVEDMRDLRDRAVYAPAESRYRIFIIDEAHMITTSGANALLKIVEEPPEHLIFIFATTEPEKVIGTIRSRTHHYPFRLLTPQAMRGLIERTVAGEGARVEESVYPLVIRAGGGSPRDTLSVLDQLLAGSGPEGLTYEHARMLLGATDETLLDAAVTAVAAGDRAGVFEIVDDVIEAGLDPRRFATDLLDRFRDLMVLQAVPDAISLGLVDAPTDRADILREQAGAFAEGETARLAALVNDGLSDLRGATSPRLLLEILCAKMLLPQVVAGVAGAAAQLAPSGAGAAAGGAAQVDPAKMQAAAKYDRAAMRRAREQAKNEQAKNEQTRAEQAQPEQNSNKQEAPAQPQQEATAQTQQNASAQQEEQQREVASAVEPQRAAAQSSETQQPQASVSAQPAPSADSQPVPSGPTGDELERDEHAQEQPSAAEQAEPSSNVTQGHNTQASQATVQPQEGENAEPADHTGGDEPGEASQSNAQPQPVGREDVGDLDQDIRAKWATIRDTAFKLHSVTGIMLTEAKVLGFRGGTLVIGHNTGALANRLNDPSNNDYIVQAIEQELGARVPVECVVGTNPEQQGIQQRPKQQVWNPGGSAAAENQAPRNANPGEAAAAQPSEAPKQQAQQPQQQPREAVPPRQQAQQVQQVQHGQHGQPQNQRQGAQPPTETQQQPQDNAPAAAADPWGAPAPIGGQAQAANADEGRTQAAQSTRNDAGNASNGAAQPNAQQAGYQRQQDRYQRQAPAGFGGPSDATVNDEIPLPPEPPEFEAPPEPYGYGADEGMPAPARSSTPTSAETQPKFQQAPPQQSGSRVDLGAARQQFRERQAQQQQPQQPEDEEASRRAEEEEMFAQAASESGERDSRDALTVAMDLLAEELGARKV